MLILWSLYLAEIYVLCFVMGKFFRLRVCVIEIFDYSFFPVLKVMYDRLGFGVKTYIERNKMSKQYDMYYPAS